MIMGLSEDIIANHFMMWRNILTDLIILQDLIFVILKTAMI